ncbi:MAG: cytochrome P450 [Streptosporangiaceae bacterium]|jgi:cytochrome P450
MASISLLIKMMRNRATTMADAAAQYGDAVKLPMGPMSLYLFSHPDYAKHVLADNPGNYRKGIGQVHARRAIGDGLLTSEGELWRRQRRTIQPAFQPKRIAKQAGVIGEEAAKLVERLRAHEGDGPVDVREEMTGLTLGVLGHALLDSDISAFDAIGESFEAVQDQAMFELMSMSMVPMWVPLPRQLRFRRARAYLEGVVQRLVAERSAHPTDTGDDVVSRLIESTRQESDPRVARIQMRDELFTLLLAGHETTASTLSWAFYYADHHPEVWDQLHEEASRVLTGDTLSHEDLRGLTYTTRVLEESMRLRPPVWLLSRVALAEDTIGEYHVPAGADVLISPFILHRHPAFWTEPERFDPDRFTPERTKGRHRYAYIPFGAGPRFCVGNSLGMMEATIVLATVARDLRLKKVPGYVVDGEPMLTMRVRGGLPMTVHSLG